MSEIVIHASEIESFDLGGNGDDWVGATIFDPKMYRGAKILAQRLDPDGRETTNVDYINAFTHGYLKILLPD